MCLRLRAKPAPHGHPLTVQLNMALVADAPLRSVTVTVGVKTMLWVGVPLMRPDDAFIVSPVGRLLAE